MVNHDQMTHVEESAFVVVKDLGRTLVKKCLESVEKRGQFVHILAKENGTVLPSVKCISCFYFVTSQLYRSRFHY